MSYEIECPSCHATHDMLGYPDHWQGSDNFTFECDECGAEFKVSVDYEPIFCVYKGSVKKPPKGWVKS